MKVSLFVRASIAVVALAIAVPAFGQILPRRQTGGQANPPGVGAQVAPAPGETAGQTRREGRQEAREARAESREAGAGGIESRQAARDTRQATRNNIQATRAADYGVWFNSAPGANRGLVINDLANNGMFYNAGFRPGDQLVSVNGQPIASETQFVQYLSGPNLGTQPVQYVVLRNGQQQTLTLQPTALSQGIVNYDPFYQYGFVVDDSRPNQYVVQRVYPRTPAYYAGIRQGDVINSFGGQPITSLNAFSQSLSQANGQMALGINRNGQTQNIQLDAIGPDDGTIRTAQRPNFDNLDGAAAGARLNGRTQGQAAPGATAPPAADLRTPASQPNSPVAAPPGDGAAARQPGRDTAPAEPGRESDAQPGRNSVTQPGRENAAPSSARDNAPASPPGAKAGPGASTTPAPRAAEKAPPAAGNANPTTGAGQGKNPR